MSRLPVVTNREMLNYLQKKGFAVYQGQRHYVLRKDEKRTQVPRHGNKDLGKGLLRTILQQAGIPIEEFKDEF